MSLPPSPRGRAAVSDALLSAAAELFAQKGPRATSVREIAAAAGVNHGLVHQYFGSKDQLLRASLERLAHEVTARLDAVGVEDIGYEDAGLENVGSEDVGSGDVASVVGVGPSASVEHVVDLHWRALARALLDGEDPASLQRDYPAIDRLLARARQRGLDEVAARRAAAHVVTVELGWRLFHGFIAAALDLEEDPDAVRRELLSAAWGTDV